MKKLCLRIAALFTLFLLLSLPAEAADVYGDNIPAEAGKTVMIPIYIKNNDGVMGFKITVKYDPEFLKEPSAYSAGLTEVGLFNDSIENATSGAFDVVWCGSEEQKGDGELMVLGFTVCDNVSGSTEVCFDYSPNDTFNEKWEAVSFNLLPVTLTVGSDSSAAKSSTEGAEINDKNFVKVVDIVLQQSGVQDVSKMNAQKKAEILNRVNDLLSQMNIPQKDQPKNFDALYSDYVKAEKSVFIEELTNTINVEGIAEALDASMKKSGYKDIKEIPKEKAKEVLNDTVEELKEINPDISLNTESLSQDEIIDVIEKISGINENNSPEKPSYIGLVIGISVCLIFVIVGLILFLKKRKG